MLRMGKGQEDFVNLCIAHRHQMCSGNVGYGCSIGILTQSYSAIASVPRPVRENCTLLCLFLNSDEKQRNKIKEELSDIPNLEDFEGFRDYATSKEPHPHRLGMPLPFLPAERRLVTSLACGMDHPPHLRKFALQVLL